MASVVNNGDGSDGGGFIPFTNLSNAKVEDGSFSTAICATSQGANIIFSNFGFSIPSNAISLIATFEVKIKSTFASDTSSDVFFSIVNGSGAVVGDPDVVIAFSSVITNTLTWKICDGNRQSWIENLTDINSSNFGFRLDFLNNNAGADTYSIDSNRITITYSLPAGGTGSQQRTVHNPDYY